MEKHARRLNKKHLYRVSLSCLGAAVLSTFVATSAQALVFGHARMASPAGDPLVVLVPVDDMSPADAQSLTARPAPAEDWAAAQLTPPVDLDSLSITVTAGLRDENSRVLRIRSSQPFSAPMADLLLDVHTASSQQRYQVSLVTGMTVRPEAPATAAKADAPDSVSDLAPAQSLTVQTGDTMFALARRHAVAGVSLYQWMLAVQRANPRAFIHDNINLVRAGAQLIVPGTADMLSISDREARRQFILQQAAFAELRGQSMPADAVPDMSLAPAAIDSLAPGQADAGSTAALDQATTHGSVSQSSEDNPAASVGSSQDRLLLTEPESSSAADAQTADEHAIHDSQTRVAQLEDNVRNLSQALKSQGEAARKAVEQGAQALGDSLQHMADSIGEAGQEDAMPEDQQAPGSSTDAPAIDDGSISAGQTGQQSVEPQTDGSVGSSDATKTDGSDASSGGSDQGKSSASEGNGLTSAPSDDGASHLSAPENAAQHSNGLGAGPGSSSSDGADHLSSPENGAPASGTSADSAQGSRVANGASGATPASSGLADGGSAASTSTSSAGVLPAVAGTGSASTPTAAGLSATGDPAAPKSKSWFQEYMLIIMTGLLAVIVFIVAWLLRRANTVDPVAEAQLADALVREKLLDIDLDLPPSRPGSDAK